MASLRRSTHRQDENAGDPAARVTRASSSTAKGTLPSKADENTPKTRRALGDIKNVLVDRQPAPQTSDSPRKPFSDRNAPVASHSKSSKNKGIEQQPSTRVRQRPKTAGKNFGHQGSGRFDAFERAGSSTAAPVSSRKKREGKTKVIEQFSHVQVPSPADNVSPTSANPLSAQIEAAAKRAEQAAPSHDELSRLSPNLDSDDLEYFDIDIILQTRPLTAAAKTDRARRDQAPSSKDEGSDAGGTASHGSSDKENVPPPAARRAATASNRQSARTRAGVLRTVQDEQPSHSTPISQKRKALRDHDDDEPLQSAGPNLDDLFPPESDRSSQVPSPGVGPRAEPMTASAKQLRDYQERGVSKVMEWKAAGHHETKRRTRDGDDVSNADSWPDDPQDGGAGTRAKGGDDDEDDLFGFLAALPHARDRSTQMVTESFSFGDDDDDGDGSQIRSEHDDSDLYAELPTDPFNTSDDRRLAEKAFAHMSSPPAPHHDSSSSTAQIEDAVPLGKHKLHAAPREGADTHAEDEGEDDAHEQEGREADTSSRRVTRSNTKAKGAAAPAVVVSETDEEQSPPSSPPPATRKRREIARKAASGIPLKRNEKKEQEMIEKLAAQESSSPAQSSSPPSSPRASRTSKKGATSPAANKLRMDDILSLLPPRKRQAAVPKTPASVNRRKGNSATTRTSKTAATPKSKAAGRKNNGRKRKGSAPEEDVVVVDDSDEAPRSKTARRNTWAKSASTSKKGKKRVVSDDEDEEEDEDKWRKEVGSSPVHSDDSERTKRLKEFRALENYHMEVEHVL